VTHEYEEDGQDSYYETCTPTYFNPALPMLRLPRGCTGTIASELTKAWAVYWSDPGACVNHLRTSIERLMDHLGIPKSTLHKSIEAYRQKEPDLSDSLMAIKWLGNSGSHGDAALTNEDVLDALPLLEHVLGEVFEMRTAERRRLRDKLLEKHVPTRAKKDAT
jgi:hypothetical protein